jgi:homoserine dehydrogenase
MSTAPTQLKSSFYWRPSAFGAAIPADAPFKQGVDSVAPEDLEFAKELGYRIKHLGIAQRDAEDDTATGSSDVDS